MREPSPPSGADLQLGIDGLSFLDLHRPDGLRRLSQHFDGFLARVDPELYRSFENYRSGGGNLPPPAESELLVRLAARAGHFVAGLFRIEPQVGRLAQAFSEELRLFAVRRDFVSRRVFKKGGPRPPAGEFSELDSRMGLLLQLGFPQSHDADPERAVAESVLSLLELERNSSADSAKERFAALRSALLSTEEGRHAFGAALAGDDTDSGRLAAVRALLALAEQWTSARALHPEAKREIADWPTHRLPRPVDPARLVEIEHPERDRPEVMEGPCERRRRRDGFELTDRRMSRRQVAGEVDYCVLCHERCKDSCARGFPSKDPAAEGTYQKNPAGVPLSGCPLGERISEAHLLKSKGEPLGALAMVMLDNPLCPGTGHRICNDCMKACIFQKQEPVNIPQVETAILTDVLSLPYGVEIYGLLTRWNPLNVKRPHALPYNGKKVLVVGLGPAGYTLAHHLLNEGFGVAGIDGLKIEPLPDELTGHRGARMRPVRDFGEICRRLDQRVLAGFGGVSEYGITVRWDKNFLTLLHLTLARRENLRLYGGVRFGGTLTLEDAWELGFDHVAIAAGAGKPTVIGMKNNLLRGIRKASDFLMALQLTGAFKRESLANLQVQLPAVVIGGGLTAIDTATELVAYYPVQVEKVLARHERLCARFGEEAIRARLDEEEREILDRFLEHGRAVREERERATNAGELPDLARLVRVWGGVSICYRRTLSESPAYRLSHEEIIKAFEEGIRFIERMSPTEAVPDEHGAVKAVKFERMAVREGKLRGTGEIVELPARTVCVAAGTSPNVTCERERPGTFQLDDQGSFFRGFEAVEVNGGFELREVRSHEDLGRKLGFFTSYRRGDRLVSFYGDNHPTFAGNVVKAMASAKRGHREIARLFARELSAVDFGDGPAQVRRDAELGALFSKLGEGLSAKVVAVNRLTPTIVEVVARAPFAAARFQPGQFYRLQNFESLAPVVDGTRLATEGLALTGAWVDKARGLLSVIVLETGASSRLCATLSPGQPIVLMGPTGSPTEIPRRETVLLAGGGLGNAVLFSIGQALKAAGSRVLYFAAYRRKADCYKREEIEAAADQVIWSVDDGELLEPRRPQDTSFLGNVVQAMVAFAEGGLGVPPSIRLAEVERIIAIGSDRMMNAVKQARHSVLAPHLKTGHQAIASINSTMQCMMKEVCAQCLQRHVDPATGKESVVFSCFNQDQKLDHVDFGNLSARLKANSVLEKLSNLWLDHLLEQAPELKKV
ncbi:MAG: FAD-dependent oxidoreductase [Myxococcales bacterium]|nr:FAD-dependent oxidoreductase [Myxococcales bacterium]